MSDYQLFNMCPFTMAQIGGGGGIGLNVQSYTWTHSPCMEIYCKLWTFKKTEDGEGYQGCIFEFMGLTSENIKEDRKNKNYIISGKKEEK